MISRSSRNAQCILLLTRLKTSCVLIGPLRANLASLSVGPLMRTQTRLANWSREKKKLLFLKKNANEREGSWNKKRRNQKQKFLSLTFIDKRAACYVQNCTHATHQRSLLYLNTLLVLSLSLLELNFTVNTLCHGFISFELLPLRTSFVLSKE